MAQHLDETNYPKALVSQAWELIQNAQKITLLTHYRPDGDGISACAAFEAVLEKLGGKEVETIYPTETEYDLTRHPKNKSIAAHTYKPDLIVAFDTANKERLYWSCDYDDVPLINIDHHISNSIEGRVNFVDAGTASACEVLHNLLNIWCPEHIDKYVAECLLFGSICDSQVFHTQNTTANTLRNAADLMDKGANLFALSIELLSNKNPQIIKLWGNLLASVTISSNGNAAWAILRQSDLDELGLTLASLVGFINFLSEISGIDAHALFVEMGPDQTKVSLRSKHADVNAIAAQFGGGGHRNASGISIEKPLNQALADVTAALEAI